MSKKQPLKYALVRNVSCLAPISIIWQAEQSCICFTVFADLLNSLKKISSSVADISKDHYEELLKMAKYEHKEDLLSSVTRQID